MNDSDFEELVASIQEAGEIKRGTENADPRFDVAPPLAGSRMNPEIKIRLLPPTPYGRLNPHYAADVRMLILEAERPQEGGWPKGITVDATAVFDADAEGRVVNVDIMVHKSRWKKVRELPGRPAKQRLADLQLAESTLAHRFFDNEVDVLTNPGRTRVLVTFAPRTDAATAAILSDQVLAIIEDNHLVALDIDLA